jgi:hypothetical protein
VPPPRRSWLSCRSGRAPRTCTPAGGGGPVCGLLYDRAACALWVPALAPGKQPEQHAYSRRLADLASGRPKFSGNWFSVGGRQALLRRAARASQGGRPEPAAERGDEGAGRAVERDGDRREGQVRPLVESSLHRFEDGAPSARVVPPGAQAVPTHPGAPPGPLGSSARPQERGPGRPKREESARAPIAGTRPISPHISPYLPIAGTRPSCSRTSSASTASVPSRCQAAPAATAPACCCHPRLPLRHRRRRLAPHGRRFRPRPPPPPPGARPGRSDGEAPGAHGLSRPL